MNDLNDEKTAPVVTVDDAWVRRLLRSNEELEHFARVVAHDLQEPLRAIAGCMGLLKAKYHGKLDAGANECMTLAVDGAVRMHTFITDLLAYSVQGTGVKNLQRVDTVALFGTTMANLRESIQESGAVVTHDGLPVIDADSLQMGQLFQNLIGNAIKYRRNGQKPQVHVGARRRNGSWVFSVRDDGIGIAQEHAESIFEPFKRLHPREEFAGSGIGLALCKKIVENHGGRIWMQAANPGSCFSFTIPVVDEAGPDPD